MHVPINRFYSDAVYSSTKETYDTVLSLACEFNRSEFVDYILKKGADVNKPNRSTMTPIMVNSRQGNIKIFNVLLGHGANVYSKTGKDPSPLVYHEERSPIHRTALMFASQFGHDMIVKKLLTLLDIDSINEKDSGDLSALMTAVDHKHSKVVKLLLPKIKNVNEIKTCLGKAYNNRDGPTQKVLTAFLSALSVSSSSSSHAKP